MPKKQNKSYASGSYTVEAAFIVPMLLGIFFVILYVLFLLHDKAVLQANLQNVLYLLAEEQISCQQEEYERYLEQSLWLMEVTESEIKKGGLSFSGKVTAEAELNIPVLSFFMAKSQKVEMAEECRKLQPEQIKGIKKRE